MNEKRSDMQIIRDMLKIGTAPETSMQNQLGLEESEFHRYRRHLLKRGFATETIDPTQDFILQPTAAGQALMRLIDTMEFIETRYQPKESLPAVALSSNIAMAAMLMRDRMYQGYILEQAEVVRLKALLKHHGGDEELAKEHRQREQKLGMLQEFLGVLDHMVGDRDD